MPKPIRTDRSWGHYRPVMQDDLYGILHINLNKVELVGTDALRIGIGEVIVGNAMYQAEELRYAERLELVRRCWHRKDAINGEIGGLLAEHERQVRAGGPILERGLEVVKQLQEEMARSAGDFGIVGNAPTGDVLPSLVEAVAIADVSSQPVPLDAIHPEQQELRRRSVRQWAQHAARGAESARFRRQMREAYRSTCVICGLQLPPLGGDGNPGVDAAHILPWRHYDLDVVQNGLCLCKLHHWAFDEGLIEVRKTDSGYAVAVPPEAEERVAAFGAGFSAEFLRQCQGAIQGSRLPENQGNWPSQAYLEERRRAFNPEQSN
jgi:hypothetical protein